MNLRRTSSLALVLGLVTFTLVGCGLGDSSTTDTNAVVEAAEDSLEGVIGERPVVDCGDNRAVDVVEGTTLDCTLIDPSTDFQFDAVVTIVVYEEGGYGVDVKVDPESSE